MISELSNEQTNALSKGKAAALVDFLKGNHLDKVDASAALLEIYAGLSAQLEPRIFFSEGPDQGIKMLRHLLGMGEQGSGLPNLDLSFGAYAKARNLSDQLFGNHVEAAEEIKVAFNGRFSSETAAYLRNMVLYDLNFQIVSQVAAPIFKSLDLSLAQVSEGYRHRPALYPSWYDADWTSFYALCDQCLDTGLEAQGAVREFIASGAFMVFAYDLFALIVPRPALISLDDIGRLHAEGGAAVGWNDGSKIYFWHGLEVPALLIEQPDAVSKQEVIQETNAEMRRCYLEILGSERFGALLGLELLDESRDPCGNALKLFRTAERDKLAGDHIYFGAVVCPSTQRRYFLCVPPTIKSAVEAVSWTFGKTPENYKPEIET